MIAKIVEKDQREYYSAVFALCGNGWDTAVIVYDQEERRFSFVNMYGFTKNITRSVFIIDCDEKDFVEQKRIRTSFWRSMKHVRGYDWLVENKQLFIDILKNRPIDERYREKAENVNREIAIAEWTLVKNERDVENLMSTAWGFHDAIIERIVFDGEHDVADIIFSGCWGCKITLRFQLGVEIHVSHDEFFEIMDSNVFFENGYVYWADDYKIKSEAELTKKKNVTFFKARALSWKQETEYYSVDNEEF